MRMRVSSVIAGSFGITLVAGVLALTGLIGVVLLLVFAPQRDPEAVRDALVDARDDLELCAVGTAGGELAITLALHRGEARHVNIDDASVGEPVAACIAEALVTRSWPKISGSAAVTVRLVR
jgi:hypothetical protein